jgi:hypothetical protein
VIIFNPIASTILKWLKFEFVRSALLNSGLRLFSIVRFPWLHRIPSLAVTIGTKACNLPNAVKLY